MVRFRPSTITSTVPWRCHVADPAAYALDARLAGTGAEECSRPFRAITASDAVAQKLNWLVRTPQASGFLFVDRQLQTIHEPLDRRQYLCRRGLAEHTKVIGIRAPLRIRDLTEDDWLNGLWPSAAMLAPGFPGVSRAPIELFPLQDRAQAISYSEYCHTAAARRFSWTRRRML